jgi:hypothetical protein
MKTTVIYHSADFDGIFCREIARKFLPDADLIGWNHGDPKILMPEEGTVYILDLSPECLCDNPKVEGLIWNRIIWIDHHKSSIEKFPTSIPGYRIDGVAACRLAWQWFTHNVQKDTDSGKGVTMVPLPRKQDFVNRIILEPLAVRLAGEYDIWDCRDPSAELFQHGLRSQELGEEEWRRMLQTVPEGSTPLRRDLINSTVEDLLASGRCVQYAKTRENKGIIESYGFDLEFEGLKILACNHARFNSHLFTAGLRPHHDACLGFNWDGKNSKWRISLYHAPGKEHHDLSEIAVKHGGGGHKGACGFTCEVLPFWENMASALDI